MTGADVVVSSSGRLSVLPSSAQFKRDIQPLGIAVVGCGTCVRSLFRPQQDPQGQRQYGRIAEQVAKVYPGGWWCAETKLR
jgi:hypothetical protein